ncbi:P pilus assembly protein [Vibrio ishigakensis]|uniref:P pilus assembly protein n=1 Tax=Vibrio ishigakensis TaxID=1481914 RepID=A0A0B8PEZ3_9VIBR|nr:P pilus assembly protein [Vibrio ishigakensis]
MWGSLQPTRNIQSGSTQTIILNETANVAVFVNDIFLGDIRLPPGRYNIDDLPLTQGANEIRFNITYQSGRTETLFYSQFYNDRLLKQGFDDFGFYAGLISQVDDRKYSYDTEQYVIQSFYDYGITDNLTAGVNSAYHPLGYIGGLTTVLGTSWGNFSLRSSFLGYDDQEELGYVNSLDYSNSLFSGLDNGSINLRLSGEAFTDYRQRHGELVRRFVLVIEQ